jgi:phosphoribosylglycinamide formyltransferase 1
MTLSVPPEVALQSLRSPHIPSRSINSMARPIKLGVLASGSGSNFAAIAEAIATHQLAAQVEVLIYNNPDAKVHQRAEGYGISTKLLNHRDYPSREG